MTRTIDYLCELSGARLPQPVQPELHETARLLSALGWITTKPDPDSGIRVDAVTFAGQAVVHKSAELQGVRRAAG